MKVKIVIVDDYHIFRKGLKLIFEKDESFTVVGETAGATELFEILQKEKPHVIVMDLMLSHKAVVSISKTLKKDYPEIPFVVITSNPVEYTILECVVNGASGIIWKDNSVEDLLKAIKIVASGERYFEIPESVLVKHVLGQTFNIFETKEVGEEISEREVDVLRLLAEGKSYKQIADELNISPRTVETHKANILSKLGLNSVADLIKYAIRNQIISLD